MLKMERKDGKTQRYIVWKHLQSGHSYFLWPVLIIFAENAIKFECDMATFCGGFFFAVSMIN